MGIEHNVRRFHRDGALFEDGLLTLAAVRAGLSADAQASDCPHLQSGELMELSTMPVTTAADTVTA